MRARGHSRIRLSSKLTLPAGDVQHTYDQTRHEWRYDTGGYAWDNGELGTDLWLWLSFMRTGRADVFHRARALTRHLAEVSRCSWRRRTLVET